MAIVRVNKSLITGLSTDAKPILSNYSNGTRFFETNTGNTYIWNRGAWGAQGQTSTGTSPSNPTPTPPSSGGTNVYNSDGVIQDDVLRTMTITSVTASFRIFSDDGTEASFGYDRIALNAKNVTLAGSSLTSIAGLNGLQFAVGTGGNLQIPNPGQALVAIDSSGFMQWADVVGSGLEKNGLGWTFVGSNPAGRAPLGNVSIDFSSHSFYADNGNIYGPQATGSFNMGGGNRIPGGSGDYGSHFVFGNENYLKAYYSSYIFGTKNTITDGYSLLLVGQGNTANVNGSVGQGMGVGVANALSGFWPFAIGAGLVAKWQGGVVLGSANLDTSEGVTAGNRPALVVGIGDVSNNYYTYGDVSLRKDGFRVLYDGRVFASSLTTTQIDSDVTGKIVVTKEWHQANSSSGTQLTQDIVIEPPTLGYQKTVSFVKASGADISQSANRDLIFPGYLEITRSNSDIIFNYATEGAADKALSPEHTMWKEGTLDYMDANDFTEFAGVTEERLRRPEFLNKTFVVKVANDGGTNLAADGVFEIQFTSWESGSGGGAISYNRTPIYDFATIVSTNYSTSFPKSTLFTKADFADVSIPANRDIIIADYLEIARGDEKGFFNYAFEASADESVSPIKTTWQFGSLGNFDPDGFVTFKTLFEDILDNDSAPPIWTVVVKVEKDDGTYLIEDSIFEMSISNWTTSSNGGGHTYRRTGLYPIVQFEQAEGQIVRKYEDSGTETVGDREFFIDGVNIPEPIGWSFGDLAKVQNIYTVDGTISGSRSIAIAPSSSLSIGDTNDDGTYLEIDKFNASLLATNTVILGISGSSNIAMVPSFVAINANNGFRVNIGGLAPKVGQVMQTTSINGDLAWADPGMVSITESSNTGWRLGGVDPTHYGNIGNNAVDLSFSNSFSNTRGATGTESFAAGSDATAEGFESISLGGYAQGGWSLALQGGNAVGSYSMAFNASAEAPYAIALGTRDGIRARAYSQVSLGRNCVDIAPSSTTGYHGNNVAFVVGIGDLTIGSGPKGLADGIRLYQDGRLLAPELTTARIDGADNKVLTTKEWVLANAGAGLEPIDEGNGIGWRLKGRDPANYGNIGENAIDFSAYFAVANQGALGTVSFAAGSDNIAGAYGSFVGGYGNNASESFATIFGQTNTNAGYASLISGYNNTINSGGNYGAIFGHDSNLSGYFNALIGTGLIGKSTSTTVVGQANLDYTNTSGSVNIGTAPHFIVGNGTIGAGPPNAVTGRSNAFEVLHNGSVIAPSLTNTLINTVGAKALITKEYADANYAGGGGISDAPSDGNEYVRKDGAWAISSGGGLSAADNGLTNNAGTVELGGTLTGDTKVNSTDGATTLQFVMADNVGESIARKLVLGTSSAALTYEDGVGDTWGDLRALAAGVRIEARDGVNFSRMFIDNTEMRVEDSINNIGFVYDDDYSANYTDRSLVDRGYVRAEAVTNETDSYATAKVQNMISLTQAEYDLITTPDANTLYIIV